MLILKYGKARMSQEHGIFATELKKTGWQRKDYEGQNMYTKIRSIYAQRGKHTESQ